MFVDQRSRSQLALKLCAQASVKPVCVRSMILSCIVGLKNNLARIIITTSRCVANINHVDRSKVKVTVCTLTLCIGFTETVRVRPIFLSCMVGFENNMAEVIIMTR